MTTKNGKDAVDLDGIRAQLRALAAERALVLSAPRPLTAALADLHRHLDSLAAQLEAGGWLAALGQHDSGGIEAAARPDATQPGLVTAVWACVARERLEAQLRALYAQWPAAVDDGQRADQLAALAKRERGLLVEEERLVTRAELDGRPIARRSNVDVSILFCEPVLQLERAAACQRA